MLLVFENSNPNFLRACLYKTQGHVERDEPYAYLTKPNLPGALEAITEESQKIVDESVAKWLTPDPGDGRSSSTSGAYRRRMQAARMQAALVLAEVNR